MIKICNGYTVPLEAEFNCFQLYTNIRLRINPSERLLIKLPYYRENVNRLYIPQLTRKLILSGLILLWSNINDKDSESCIEVIVKNDNYDRSIDRTDLSAIIGSGKCLDLKENVPFLKIYTI